MHPHQYFSSVNVSDGQNRGRGKRYHRTNSYDETYFSKQLSSAAHLKADFYSRPYNPYIETSHLPTIYSSGFVYGRQQYAPFYNVNQNTDNISTVNNPNNKPMDVGEMYRNSPMLNYAANSYLGWHKGLTTVPRQVAKCTKQVQNVTFDHADTVQYRSNPALRLNAGHTPNCYDRECMANGSNNNGLLKTHSPFSSMDSDQSPQDLSADATRKSRIKLCIIFSILVIIVAVLIAMGVAVYSQVKNQNTGLKLVRQYRGHFLVVGGNLLEFDSDLLDTDSATFKSKVKVYERKIDSIFHESSLAAIYESSQVTAFQFVVAIPAIEVHFNIRTKVNVQLQVQELLSVFEDSIRKNTGGMFSDVAIDLSSLTIENQRIVRRKSNNPNHKNDVLNPVQIS